MSRNADLRGAAALLVHEPGLGLDVVEAYIASLRELGLAPEAHCLGALAMESDRDALAELDPVLDALRRRDDVDGERLAVLGFGRGGTLAFLLGCTRRLAATIDVGGAVLYPTLLATRPTQPLELALNLEGAFLGLFAQMGGVADEERELLRQRLSAAARPFELVVLPGAGEGFFDPAQPGYDGACAEECLLHVLDFLCASLDETE